jgi:uncharacterized protein
MNTKLLKTGAGILVAGATMLLADAWFFSKYFFQLRRFRIGNSKSQKQFRILLLTDLHFKHHFWPFHQRLVRTINNLDPHLLLCAGDLIDATGTPGPARKFLNRLNPAIPKLFIPGNHDHNNSVSRHTLRKMIEENNGRLLVNETVQVMLDGEPFTITGLDDFIEGESCFADAVKEVGKEAHHLLLVHSPLQQEMILKEVEKLNRERTTDRQIDLHYIFAGHTHGGQVRFFHYLPVPPHHSGRYLKGWYNSRKPYLYVSKGFGTARLPVRLGARPEITLFEYGV